MPKMKTNKATAKRVKVTGKGKIKRSRPMRSHLKSRKSPKRLRGLRKARMLDKKYVKSAMHLLGLA
jgi:large subunit ribosomal protein L35